MAVFRSCWSKFWGELSNSKGGGFWIAWFVRGHWRPLWQCLQPAHHQLSGCGGQHWECREHYNIIIPISLSSHCITTNNPCVHCPHCDPAYHGYRHHSRMDNYHLNSICLLVLITYLTTIDTQVTFEGKFLSFSNILVRYIYDNLWMDATSLDSILCNSFVYQISTDCAQDSDNVLCQGIVGECDMIRT